MDKAVKSLLSAEEHRQLKARQRRGEILRYVSFIPVVLALVLILFVFLTNINNSFVWQLVERGGSGETFARSEVPNAEAAFKLELAARGMTPEEIEETLTDPEERRKFLLRNRADYLLEANGEPNRVVVYTIDRGIADDIDKQYGYIQGRQQKAELEAQAQEENLDLFLNPLLDKEFISRNNSAKPQMAGFHTAIIGTLWVISLVIIISTFIGVATAIYLEEYAQKGRFSNFLEVNLRNLAGVPSIVYGILGLYVFVRAFNMQKSVIAAALTLSLLILPVVVIAAREAIRAVPDSLRQASYGLGATKWQTVSRVILPNAVSGIVTGIILAVARAIGETAPLLLVGGAGFITTIPGGRDFLFDSYSAMPLQIYSYFATPDQAFKEIASAGILVLLAILIFIYLIAFVIRARFTRKW
ncbi:MAG: phosphate ABC transporter permease PstA [Trueperaceae bacterium]|nr:phosphate ABC transporter permease PstA [Trueperaceae bacterium]